MKKFLLSVSAFALVAVSAIAVAPTTAEAVPAFARQTGAACLSCHFQSFPSLAAFGRSFKMNALTDVGDQALVEDENLSIPAVLNATIVVRPQFQSQKTTGGAAVKTAAITADNVLLVGGRIGSNTGAFAEIGGGAFANIQLFNSWDIAGFKGGVNIYKTGFGETAGIELSSVFGQHGGLLNGKALSAVETINTGQTGLSGDTGGVAFWLGNETGMAQVALVTIGEALDGAVENGWRVAPLVRVLFTPEFNGWDLGIGGGIINGTTGNAATIAAVNKAVGAGTIPAGTAQMKMKKRFVDFQAQGELGDTSVGIYADWASAPKSTASGFNLYNGSTTGSLSAWSLRANVKPLHNVIFTVGFGNNKVQGAAKTDTWQLGAEYEFYQNFVAALTYTNAKTTGGAAPGTTKTTLLDIEALM